MKDEHLETIRKEFDRMVRDSGITLDDAEYESKLRLFRCGWNHCDKQYREMKFKLEAISAYMESEEFLHGDDCLVCPTAGIKRIIGV